MHLPAAAQLHLRLYCPFHSYHVQWEWWNLWFEFALLLALFITSFIDQAFKRGRLVFLAFFVMVTQGIMWSAHDFITSLVIGPINLRDIGQDAANAATAGFVLLGMTNFVLIIVLGKDFGYDAAASNSYQQTSSAAIQFQTSAPV
jgi:hypothetical protein